jgi:dolichol-phosphate mannosyltransferase
MPAGERECSSLANVVAVVPALDEAPRIARVLASMPKTVRRIVLVDDGSTDGTSRAAREVGDERVEILRHERPRGVGAAIAAGYARALALGADAAVVLAGDGQMDPRDLPALLAPVLAGEADYAKGNRFAWPSGKRAFPLTRLVGVALFSLATRLSLGLDVHDTQCGYTAIGRRALERIDWSSLWPSYGYPNDLLGRLSRARLRIVEVPVRPLYGDEESKLRPRHLPPIALLLARAAALRVADALRLRYLPLRVEDPSHPPAALAGTGAVDLDGARDLHERAGRELVRGAPVHVRAPLGL